MLKKWIKLKLILSDLPKTERTSKARKENYTTLRFYTTSQKRREECFGLSEYKAVDKRQISSVLIELKYTRCS